MATVDIATVRIATARIATGVGYVHGATIGPCRGHGERTSNGSGPGSAQIADIFAHYFTSRKLKTAPAAFDGRSDYGPFIATGISAGGLFSGAEGVKKAKEARTFGGTAGVARGERRTPDEVVRRLAL